MGQHGAAAAGAARFRRRGARAGPRARVRSRPASCSSASPSGPGHVELARRQGGAGVAVLHRRGHRHAPDDGFERVYDLTERVLPAAVLRAPTPDRADAVRELVRTAARALGRGHRERPAGLLPAAARGPRGRRSRSWPTPASCCPSRSPAGAPPAWLDPEARRPRWVRARALLSPFDSLVWERPRVERIFGFRYRLEIYTPAAQAGARLLRAALPARRPAGGPGRPQGRPAGRGAAGPGGPRRGGRRAAEVAAALADELRLMADWLELDDVAVRRAPAATSAARRPPSPPRPAAAARPASRSAARARPRPTVRRSRRSRAPG